MRLVHKRTAPPTAINAAESILGGWIFDILDFSALTILSEEFIWKMEDCAGVTNKADIQYHSPLYPHNHVEVYAEIVNASASSVEVKTVMKSRSIKSNIWDDIATATFHFSVINLSKNRTLVRIPKEVIDEFKR